MKKFRDKLGGLPLAITQAFAFMKENNYKEVRDYIRMMKDYEEIKRLNPTTSLIYNTFLIALKRMKEINPNIDQILEIVPYLSPDHLTVKLIEDFQNKKSFKKEIKILTNYSILIPSGKSLKVHRITQ